MSRYAAPQATSVQTSIEGDSKFLSVNMKLDRSLLEPGVLALSINKRLRKGAALTRDGIWPPVFANILNPVEIKGWGVYTNPNGDEVIMVATGSEVHMLADGSYPRSVNVDGQLADSVEFVQAHDKIYIYQGTTMTQLVWDGVNPKGFVKMTKTDPEDTSTRMIPPAVTAEHIADRIVVIKDENNILISDIGVYDTYDHILGVFYVDNDSGSTDAVKRVFNYAKGIAIIFSSRSMSLLLNFTGVESNTGVELLHSQIGLAGRKAVCMVGGDVMFLSEPGGVYRIAQAFENRQQVLSLPVTDPIQPFIERINWRAAEGACAAQVGEYVYFAVPVDGSTVNNAVIVYNGATNVVEGYDTFPIGFQIDDFKTTIYSNERKLYALDKNMARIYVMNEGKSDFIYRPVEAETDGTEFPHDIEVASPESEHQPTEYHIHDLIETRGYATLGWNSATRRDFKKVEIAVSTWTPSLQVSEMTETLHDVRPIHLTPITKSQTEYDTFAQPDYIPTNENNDWERHGRQDYTVTVDDIGFLPSSTEADTAHIGMGMDFDQTQTATLKFSTKMRGRWSSYRVENRQGQCSVNGILVESTGTQREPRRAG